jgi:hypothetical protein
MRTIILFIVLFEISSCATPFTHGNIAFDHVSSSSNIVSKDSIFVSARLMSPTEANEVFCGKFVRYDHTVAKTQIYVPITNIQPCVLSILNNGNDTITFKATETNNYVGRDAIQNCLTFRDQSAGGLLVCSGLLFIVLSPSLATAAPVSLVMGAFFLAGGIGTIAQEDQKEKEISQYLKTISPDVLKIAPYQEK